MFVLCEWLKIDRNRQKIKLASLSKHAIILTRQQLFFSRIGERLYFSLQVYCNRMFTFKKGCIPIGLESGFSIDPDCC